MSRVRIRYRHMVPLFMKIGASSFGGWAAAAVLMEKELVKKRKLLSSEQMQGAVGYAQMLPGATQVSLVAHAGYRLRGMYGACVATASYLTVPVAMIAIFTVTYFRFLHQSPNLISQLDGVIAALVGVILANAYRIGSRYASKLWLWSLVGVALFVRLQFKVDPLVILMTYALGALLVAIVVLPMRRRRTGRAGDSVVVEPANASEKGMSDG